MHCTFRSPSGATRGFKADAAQKVACSVWSKQGGAMREALLAISLAFAQDLVRLHKQHMGGNPRTQVEVLDLSRATARYVESMQPKPKPNQSDGGDQAQKRFDVRKETLLRKVAKLEKRFGVHAIAHPENLPKDSVADHGISKEPAHQGLVSNLNLRICLLRFHVHCWSIKVMEAITKTIQQEFLLALLCPHCKYVKTTDVAGQRKKKVGWADNLRW